jgi:hypothetical protein
LVAAEASDEDLLGARFNVENASPFKGSLFATIDLELITVTKASSAGHYGEE